MLEAELGPWAEGLVRDGVVTGVIGAVSSNVGDFSFARGRDVLGRPVESSNLVAARCALTKPLLGMAAARLMVDGVVSLDATVHDVLGEVASRSMRSVRLVDLLSHTAGLHHMGAPMLALLAPGDRLDFVLSVGPQDDWDVGGRYAYDDGASFLVAGRMLEEMSGVGYVDLIASLGVVQSPSLVMRAATRDDLFERAAFDGRMVEGRPIPMLAPFVGVIASEWNPSWAGVCSPLALAAVHRELSVNRAAPPFRDVMECFLRPRAKDDEEGATVGLGANVDMGLRLDLSQLGEGSYGHFARACTLVVDHDRGWTGVLAMVGAEDSRSLRWNLTRTFVELALRAHDDASGR